MRSQPRCNSSPPHHKTGWGLAFMGILMMTGQLSGCALAYRDLQPPTAELITIQPLGLQNDLSLTVLTRLRISNPNPVELPIQGGQLETSLNGRAIAASTLTEKFSIPPNGNKDVDVRSNVDLAAALAIGLTVINNQQADIDWQLNGYVDVGLSYLGRVPIRESGAIQMGASVQPGATP